MGTVLKVKEWMDSDKTQFTLKSRTGNHFILQRKCDHRIYHNEQFYPGPTKESIFMITAYDFDFIHVRIYVHNMKRELIGYEKVQINYL